MRASRLRFCLGLWVAVGVTAAVSAQTWTSGTRVIVEKAGAGHRAIVLRSEPARTFVAYEGADESHDEWVEPHRIRSAQPVRQPEDAGPAPADRAEGATPSAEGGDQAMVAPLLHNAELPRAARTAPVAEVWLEPLARESAEAPLRYQTAALTVPRFDFGPVAGIPTSRGPVRAALLHTQGRVRGFAAIEDGVVLYARAERVAFERVGELDLASLDGFTPQALHAADLNQDGESDLVLVAGPLVQVFFGTSDGRFLPALQPYRAPAPIGGVTAGRFFTGALHTGLAVIEGYNSLRLLSVAQSGVTAAADPFEVKFDRVTRLAAGDFDGDGFADLAVATEHRGEAAGVWMYFNQRGASKPFLWPVAGRDNFARDLLVADLDRDGRDDLVLTDSDVERGSRVRVVFGSAGRAGWEDPWELLASEFGLGLGTASIVVGDFNRDGRPDVGIGGRNGLRVHLGADYRRFSRNPVWPQLAAGGEFPEQRAFLAGDFDGDGGIDLLGYTPVFATGYNIVFNATAAHPEAVHLPAPLRRRSTVRQASATTATVEGAPVAEVPVDGPPQLRYLASRAEPYGQWRYRIVVEVAALHEGVIESLQATCKFEGADQPVQQLPAVARRTSDQQWSVEITLPRGRTYEFNIVARDDKGRESEPLRVTVSP